MTSLIARQLKENVQRTYDSSIYLHVRINAEYNVREQSPTHNVESFSNDRLKSVGGLGEIGIVIDDSHFTLVCFRSSKKVPSSFNTEVCDPIIDLIWTGLFPSFTTRRSLCSTVALRSIVISLVFNSSNKESMDSDDIKRGGMTSPDLIRLVELIAVRSHNMPRLLGNAMTAAMVLRITHSSRASGISFRVEFRRCYSHQVVSMSDTVVF